MQQPGTEKADPGSRRTAKWMLLAVLLTGALFALAIGAAGNVLRAWIERQFAEPGGGARFLAVMILAMLPVVAGGVHMFVFGARSARASRFPPPGARVLLREMRVITGEPARRRGRLLQLLAGLLVLAALMLPVTLWGLIRDLSPAG